MSSQLDKVRQRRLKKLENSTKFTDDKPVTSFYYPKNNLYTRQEFELLDTIYADEPSNINEVTQMPELQGFWPQNKEEILNLSNQPNNFLSKLTWFGAGVILTSLVWLIYFQISVHAIKTKHQTQFVFHKSAEILTDKTADEQLTKTLLKQASPKFSFSLPNLFAKKPVEAKPTDQIKPEEKTQLATEQNKVIIPIPEAANSSQDLTYHTIENVNKIAKANKLKLNSVLALGRKLTIPN